MHASFSAGIAMSAMSYTAGCTHQMPAAYREDEPLIHILDRLIKRNGRNCSMCVPILVFDHEANILL